MAGERRVSGIDIDDSHFKTSLKAALHAMTIKGETGLQMKAHEVANRAKELCPVKHGVLRSSIHVEPLQHDRKGAFVKIGTNVEYARRIEFGFMDKTDKRGRLYHQKPQPYMRPALAEATGGSFPMKHTDPTTDQPEAA